MLSHAFKEWAVICEALAQGKQSLILRKGGVAEEFRLEHKRFWLYPTYTHQQEQGVRSDARPLFEKVLAEKPADGIVRLSHFAEVTGFYHVRALMSALLIGHLHLWSDDTVEKRFGYRAPWLNVLSVRVYRAAQVHEISESDEQRGCKSWAALEQPLPTDPATPILTDKEYADVQMSLDLLLTPTAFA